MKIRPQMYARPDDKPPLAYCYKADNQKTAVLFCTGFRSDMEGTKALALEAQCAQEARPFLRFDYRGHGLSGGVFEKSNISDWLIDVQDMVHFMVHEKNHEGVLIVGSSLGGWLALRAAEEMPNMIKGLVLLAPAPDFTKELFDDLFDDEQRATLMSAGQVAVENEYSDAPYIFTKALIEDGAKHCLLERRIDVQCPITIIQGMKDTDVPWQKAHRICNALSAPENAKVILREEADHRLSSAADLNVLADAVREMVKIKEA
jgi:pimeloyl-ACP methyl ester carboxylesterase